MGETAGYRPPGAEGNIRKSPSEETVLGLREIHERGLQEMRVALADVQKKLEKTDDPIEQEGLRLRAERLTKEINELTNLRDQGKIKRIAAEEEEERDEVANFLKEERRRAAQN